MADTERDWRGLSDEELSLYASQGYLHLRGVFSEAEVDLGLEIVDRAVHALTVGGTTRFPTTRVTSRKARGRTWCGCATR